LSARPSYDGPQVILGRTLGQGGMTYYEVDFRLQHQCPYSAFSAAHPTVVISHWCNWNRDVIEILHPQDPVSGIRRDLVRMLRVLGSKLIRESQTGPRERVIIQHCACDRLPLPTLPSIEERDCLNLQPMIYSEGWERYRIVAFSNRDVTHLFRELERRARVQLLSRRTIEEGSIHESLMISTASLLSGLTEKQSRALVNALDQGYYTLPRGASALEIAQRLGVPRTSFAEHLRKAQNKVIASVGPYLRMRAPAQ